MHQLSRSKTAIHPLLDASHPLPLGAHNFAASPDPPPTPLPTPTVNIFSLPDICMIEVLNSLDSKALRQLRLGSTEFASQIDRLGVKRVEIVDKWSFSLASRFKSLLIVEIHASSDDDLLRLIDLAETLPLLQTLHIRAKVIKEERTQSWKQMWSRRRDRPGTMFKPSVQALIRLFHSLDRRQRVKGVAPSSINIVCHFPVDLIDLPLLSSIQNDSRLSISLTETILITSTLSTPVFCLSHLLSEIKIDFSQSMATSLFGQRAEISPIPWPPRLKKLDMGIVIQPAILGLVDFVISSGSMSGISSLPLESVVIRGEAALSPCFFELLGQLGGLQSLTLWMRRHWLAVNHLAPLSQMSSLTSLQVARLDLEMPHGTDQLGFKLPCLQAVQHLNFYLLEGGDFVLKEVFPNLSHTTLRDWPLCSDPIHLSGLSRRFSHLTLMQHSPCPAFGVQPALHFNAAVNRHVQSLASISGSIKSLVFRNIIQEHHIGSLFDLIKTYHFPSLCHLTLMAKEGTPFTSARPGQLSTLSPSNPFRPIKIQTIVLDAGGGSWAAHNILEGCLLPSLKSLTITRAPSPIQVSSLISILRGTSSIRVVELPASFPLQKAVNLKRLLERELDRERSTGRPEIQVSVESDPNSATLKKPLRLDLMRCLAPRVP